MPAAAWLRIKQKALAELRDRGPSRVATARYTCSASFNTPKRSKRPAPILVWSGFRSSLFRPGETVPRPCLTRRQSSGTARVSLWTLPQRVPFRLMRLLAWPSGPGLCGPGTRPTTATLPSSMVRASINKTPARSLTWLGSRLILGPPRTYLGAWCVLTSLFVAGS